MNKNCKSNVLLSNPLKLEILILFSQEGMSGEYVVDQLKFIYIVVKNLKIPR